MGVSEQCHVAGGGENNRQQGPVLSTYFILSAQEHKRDRLIDLSNYPTLSLFVSLCLSVYTRDGQSFN